MGLKIGSLLGGLFPGLRARQDAKRYNKMVEIADRVENVRRSYSNKMAANEAAFNAWQANVATGKIARNLGANLGNLSADYSSHNTAKLVQDLSQRMSEGQALGAAYAEQAMNGTAGTALANQINAATKDSVALRRAQNDAMDLDDARQYKASTRELVSAAFDSMPTSIYAARLDKSVSKSQKMKVGSAWNAAIRDVGTLVAAYYGGAVGYQAASMVLGPGDKSARAQAGMQEAANRIYGGNAPQLSRSSNIDMSGLIGMAGAYFSGGKGAFSGGRFNWGSGMQYGALGARSTGYQNFWKQMGR